MASAGRPAQPPRRRRRCRSRESRNGLVRVGDLDYKLTESTLDLGMFARQPRLWIGNPVAGVPSRRASPDGTCRCAACRGRFACPGHASASRTPSAAALRLAEDDGRLREVHELCAGALFGDADEAARRPSNWSSILGTRRLTRRARSSGVGSRRSRSAPRRASARWRTASCCSTSRRSTTTRRSPPSSTRAVSFLDEENIAIIASARHGERRLQALRQRLYSYRTRLAWPGPASRRAQFTRVFRLLADFARRHSDFFPAVQAELACWALFREDDRLAKVAEAQLDRADAVVRGPAAASRWAMRRRTSPTGASSSSSASRPPSARRCARCWPTGRSSCARWRTPSARIASPGPASAPAGCGCRRSCRTRRRTSTGSASTSPTASTSTSCWSSAATCAGRTLKDTVLWLTALSGHAFGTPALPRFGAWRRDLGADLDRVRQRPHRVGAHPRTGQPARRPRRHRDGRGRGRSSSSASMAAFFRGWEQSGYRIVPGSVTPANVALSDADFHENGEHPLAGGLAALRRPARDWSAACSAGSIGCRKPTTRKSRDTLQLGWIFDAAFEALGDEGHRALPAQQPRGSPGRRPATTPEIAALQNALSTTTPA